MSAAADIRLHVAEVGRGEPLVLLHGLGASNDDWEYQLAAFSKRFHCIAPDFRGFGLSPRVSPYSIEQFAGDIWTLLEGLGIDRFRLIGHSMGGAVAMQMAVDQPGRIESLVLADTLPSFRTNTLGRRMMFATRYATMGLLGPKRLAGAIAMKLFPNADQAALRERVRLRGESNDRGVYLETIRNLVTWAVTDRLSRLSMPVLVVAAEHDYFPLADAEAFAHALPDARLIVFPGAHHALPLESPQEFNAAVLQFLDAPASVPKALAAPPAAASVAPKKRLARLRRVRR
jgi:pimeloyl-ACP methyl ester carboxylesterase